MAVHQEVIDHVDSEKSALDVYAIERAGCRICGAAGADFICQTYNPHSSTRSIQHFRCNSCGVVFVGNQFSDDELGEAYGSLDATAYYEEIQSENRKKMEYAADKLGGLLDKNGRIIDIGTGDGLFVQVLTRSGFRNVSCHEIPGTDLSAVADIAESIYADFDFQSIPSTAFDVVTMLDVMEHVRDPRSVLENCYRILKPNGIVYFHTPVVTRMDRLMHVLCKLPFLRGMGRTWQTGRTSVFHLRNYTRQSLKILLGQTQFELVELNIKNELSWPVSMYVRVYLVDKFKLPAFVTTLVTPLMYPLLATNFFNANKSIVIARRLS